MKNLISLAILVFVGWAGFRIGGELSPDALGMAIGMLFGVMAGIPTALILLASQRRESSDHRPAERPQAAPERPQGQITVNNYHKHLHVNYGASEAVQPVERKFRIIGSDE